MTATIQASRLPDKRRTETTPTLSLVDQVKHFSSALDMLDLIEEKIDG